MDPYQEQASCRRKQEASLNVHIYVAPPDASRAYASLRLWTARHSASCRITRPCTGATVEQRCSRQPLQIASSQSHVITAGLTSRFDSTRLASMPYGLSHLVQGQELPHVPHGDVIHGAVQETVGAQSPRLLRLQNQAHALLLRWKAAHARSTVTHVAPAVATVWPSHGSRGPAWPLEQAAAPQAQPGTAAGVLEARAPPLSAPARPP